MFFIWSLYYRISKSAFTCSKSQMETIEQYVKYIIKAINDTSYILTDFTHCSGVSAVDLNKQNVKWVNGKGLTR